MVHAAWRASSAAAALDGAGQARTRQFEDNGVTLGFECKAPAIVPRALRDQLKLGHSTMRPLRITSRLGEYSVCRWHDCRGCDSPMRFAGHEAAVQWLSEFRTDAVSMRDLRAVAYLHADARVPGRLSESAVCEQLARLLAIGRLRVCGQERHEPRQYHSVAPAPKPRPEPIRVRAPSRAPQPEPEVESPTFSPNFDALAAAKVLKEAARDGVPFCEECEKAKARARGAEAAA